MATYTGKDKKFKYLFERTEDMGGATASTDGTAGVVPAPEAGDEGKFLKGDGTWAEASTADLSDVNISSPTDGQVIAYEPTSGKWTNSDVKYKRMSTTERVIGDCLGTPVYQKAYIIHAYDLTADASITNGYYFDLDFPAGVIHAEAFFLMQTGDLYTYPCDELNNIHSQSFSTSTRIYMIIPHLSDIQSNGIFMTLDYMR